MAARTRVRVLRALLSADDVSTADAWRDVLCGDSHQKHASCSTVATQSEDEASHDELLAVVGSIVPCLPEYKTFGENLCGLLEFCETQSREALFDTIVTWLTSPSSSHAIAFRRWLCEWIESEQCQRLAAGDRERWAHALRVAALHESDHELYRRLLRAMELDDATAVKTEQTPSQASDVERFLAFCWRNDAALAPVALLCATKLATLMDHADFQGDDERALLASSVAATLRWSHTLKPLLFQNLVEYLPVVQRSLPLLRCQLSPRLETVVAQFSFEPALDILTTTAASLRAFAERGAQRIRLPASAAETLEQQLRYKDGSAPSAVAIEYQLAEELVAELALVHSHLVPYVLSVVLSLTVNHRETMERAVVPGLLALMAVRDEESSLFLLLSAALLLRVAQSSVWKAIAPSPFEDCVTSLSEDAVLATDGTRQWIQRTALHHLLLDCDAQVLSTHRSLVEEVAPRASRALVKRRLISREENQQTMATP
ncbi:hypothetical protein PINS_up009689 [Pythium insidiosum]|nr:hypothetical protein PINS_up009689 [Pythium insidiosum]